MADHWMQDAFNPAKKGLLHKELGVNPNKPIPAGKLEKATHSTDITEKRRAIAAQNAGRASRRRYKVNS